MEEDRIGFKILAPLEQAVLNSKKKNLNFVLRRRKVLGVDIFSIREECGLRIFENRIMRRIFEPKRNENGERKRLHNEKLIVCTVHLI